MFQLYRGERELHQDVFVSPRGLVVSWLFSSEKIFIYVQGTKLRLIQSPMRLKLSCWRPEFFEFRISYLDVFDN